MARSTAHLRAISRERLKNSGQLKAIFDVFPKKLRFKAIPIEEGKHLAERDGYLACICNYYIIDGPHPLVFDTEDEAKAYAQAFLQEMLGAFKSLRKRAEDFEIEPYSYPNIDLEMALMDKLAEQTEAET